MFPKSGGAYEFVKQAFGRSTAFVFGWLSWIISNITIIHQVIISRPNFIQIVIQEFNEMRYIYFFSSVFYKSFLLLGFLVLFLLMTKTYKKEEVTLFLYLSIISILFSIYFNFIFHLTLVIMLIFITVYFHNNYKKNNSKQSLISYVAFVFILGGNIVDIFYSLNPIIYLSGELLTFIGFLTLFLNHVNIKNEQKKNKT